MKVSSFSLLLLASAFFGNCVSPAAAQTWPERPMTMVVPFAAGGGTDLLGRIVAKQLGEVLGQQVVVENVGGAGGMLGSARVVRSAPDGYTMVIGTTADAINQTLYKAPLYNFSTDLVPAGLMGTQPTVLLGRKDFPANTLKELTAYVKANLAVVKVGSAGVGSTGHLFCELLHSVLGISGVTHVPYRGGGPAMQDLIAGRYDYICTLGPTGKQLIEGNTVEGTCGRCVSCLQVGPSHNKRRNWWDADKSCAACDRPLSCILLCFSIALQRKASGNKTIASQIADPDKPYSNRNIEEPNYQSRGTIGYRLRARNNKQDAGQYEQAAIDGYIGLPTIGCLRLRI